MTGNMKYLGRDNVCPPQWGFSMITNGIALAGLIFVVVIPAFPLCGKFWGTVLSTLFTLWTCFVIWLHNKVGRTEPGIIPNIRSKKIDYNRPYKCRYRPIDDLLASHHPSAEAKEPMTKTRQDRIAADAFFSLKQFELVPVTTPLETEEDRRDGVH